MGCQDDREQVEWLRQLEHAEFDETERQGARIAAVLRVNCPAFRLKPGPSGMTWHRCYCAADPDGGHCTCARHLRATCVAGRWPCLSFVESDREDARAAADAEMHNAQAVIGKAGGCASRAGG